MNQNRTITKDGYMDTTVDILKEDVLEYSESEILTDGDPSKRLQMLIPEKELEKMAKDFDNMPLVVEHPDTFVNSKTHKDLAIGNIYDPFVKNGVLKANVRIFDAKIIEALGDAQPQVSAGYFSTDISEKGTFNGKNYDMIQVDLKPNHVAIVPKGRAGASIKLNSKNIMEEEKMPEKDDKIENTTKEIEKDNTSESTENKQDTKIENQEPLLEILTSIKAMLTKLMPQTEVLPEEKALADLEEAHKNEVSKVEEEKNNAISEIAEIFSHTAKINHNVEYSGNIEQFAYDVLKDKGIGMKENMGTSHYLAALEVLSNITSKQNKTESADGSIFLSGVKENEEPEPKSLKERILDKTNAIQQGEL